MVKRSSPIESKETKNLKLLPSLLLQESEVIATPYKKRWYRKFIKAGEYFFLFRFLDTGAPRV